MNAAGVSQACGALVAAVGTHRAVGRGFNRDTSRTWSACPDRCQFATTATRRSIPAALSEGSKYMVCDLGEKGFGAVATERILKGERVLHERPLLQIPPSFQVDSGLKFLIDAHAIANCEKDLTALLNQCGPEAQCRFWDLADAHAEGGKTAVGIVLTNAHSTRGSSSIAGLFADLSRFNHSCNPNLQDSWQDDDGVEVVHAVRDIEPGEELCISYVDLYRTRDERQLDLTWRYNMFDCLCPVCRLEGQEQKQSDQNRMQMQQLSGLFPKMRFVEGLSGMSEDIVDLVVKMAELLDEELSGNPQLKCRLYSDAFQLSIVAGDVESAFTMAENAWVTSEEAQGPLSRQTLTFKSYAEDPETWPEDWVTAGL